MPYLGRPPTGTGSATEIDGDLKITGQLTSNDTLFKHTLDGTDGSSTNAGDNFLIEDGGTDGSGTNAGDDICLEKDTTSFIAGAQILGVSSSGIGVPEGYQLVSSITASTTAAFTFTNMTTGYDWMYTFTNLLGATDGVNFVGLLGIAGPTFRTANYISGAVGIATTGSPGESQGNGGTAAVMFNGTTIGSASADEGAPLNILEIFDPVDASDTVYKGQGIFINTGAVPYVTTYAGKNTVAESHPAVQFKFNSGNIASGKVHQYKKPNA